MTQKNRKVWDVEANGLLDTVTSIHCMTIKEIDKGNIISLSGSQLRREIILPLLSDATELICHNEISYDIPLLEMFYGFNLIDLLGSDKIVDTLLWSQVLYPDRPMPKGCPTALKCPVTNRMKKIGPHGLESWGYRVGEKKVEIWDWRYFDEKMLHRNIVDVEINEKVYYALCKEAGIEI